MKPKLYGLITALVILVSDQITKAMILRKIETGDIEVTPFFNLILTWNRGISFGMFNGGTPPWMLMGLSFAIAAGFAVWLWRSDHKYLSVALGAVIGGALGNVIDRFRFGAVVDFLDFHVGDWHWPAFNIADSAICVGIAFAVLDGLFFEPKRKGSSSHEKTA